MMKTSLLVQFLSTLNLREEETIFVDSVIVENSRGLAIDNSQVRWRGMVI